MKEANTKATPELLLAMQMQKEANVGNNAKMAPVLEEERRSQPKRLQVVSMIFLLQKQI